MPDEPNTDRRALADELERLVERRQLGAIVRASETGIENAVARVRIAERGIGVFLGENWPTIIQALRGEGT